MEDQNLENVNQVIRGFRDFLHDISNKITIADGMVDAVIRSSKKEPFLNEKDASRLDKSANAIKAMIQMIRDERTRLIAMEVHDENES